MKLIFWHFVDGTHMRTSPAKISDVSFAFAVQMKGLGF